MDASAAPDIAILGGLSARWAALAGVAACVLDGAVRDTATLAEIGLPIWSAGRNPTCARYRMEAVEINGPVSLSGHLVRPGDYVVADDDGVCIVPHEDLSAVVTHCLDATCAEHELTALLTAASDVTEVVAALHGRTAPT
jgi:regulator of RNase E activity RraA